jgi:hypothetical protein
MKVRFTNEGGYPKAINAETGELLYATSATIEMGPRKVAAVVRLDSPLVDVTCDATVKDVKHLIYGQNDLESIAVAMAILVKRRNELERL